MNNKKNLLNMSLQNLSELVVECGLKKFQAKQIFEWLHQKMARRVDELTNISIQGRVLLEEKCHIPYLEVLKKEVSKIDGTEKYLFELEDKNTIETVLLRHKSRNTLCISTQAGCPVKCSFCATGTGEFHRNLDQSEILNQIYTINRRLIKQGDNITNIVFMGMGEPMLNIDNVINVIRILSSKEGLNISKRKITISTCGIIKGIERLLEEKLPIELAISLHAADNEKRSALIPINKKYPLEDLLDSLANYQHTTNRKLTFEYILLDGINMGEADVFNLAAILKHFDHVLNLIPYNEVEGLPYKKPNEKKINNFFYALKRQGVNVTLRKEKGSDISGACGQLKEKKGVNTNVKKN